MKLTKTELQEIIREELQNLRLTEELKEDNVITEQKIIFPLERSYGKRFYKKSNVSALIDKKNYTIKIVDTNSPKTVYSTLEYKDSPMHFVQAQNSLWKNRSDNAKVYTESNEKQVLQTVQEDLTNEDDLRKWKGFVFKFTNQLGKISDHLRNSKSPNETKKILSSLIKQTEELNKKL